MPPFGARMLHSSPQRCPRCLHIAGVYHPTHGCKGLPLRRCCRPLSCGILAVSSFDFFLCIQSKGLLRTLYHFNHAPALAFAQWACFHDPYCIANVASVCLIMAMNLLVLLTNFPYFACFSFRSTATTMLLVMEFEVTTPIRSFRILRSVVLVSVLMSSYCVRSFL